MSSHFFLLVGVQVPGEWGGAPTQTFPEETATASSFTGNAFP